MCEGICTCMQESESKAGAVGSPGVVGRHPSESQEWNSASAKALHALMHCTSAPAPNSTFLYYVFCGYTSHDSIFEKKN